MAKKSMLEMVGQVKTLPKQQVKKDGSLMNKWSFRLDVFDEKYPDVIEFTLFEKGKDEFEGNVGDTVRVVFTLGGREWNGRCFIEAKAFAVELVEKNNQTTVEEKLLDDDDDGDLPW